MIQFLVMPTFLQLLFETTIFRNSIRDGTNYLLSMTKLPPDDILESLYKLRIQSDQLQTVLELYNLVIHRKKAKPDYQRLKTTVKRSIEQNLRSWNSDARNGTLESGVLVKNQRERRVQRGQGDYANRSVDELRHRE